MNSNDIPSMFSDLSSQQIVVNHMTDELQKNESVMNTSENVVQREEHKEGMKNIRYEIMNDCLNS